MILITSIYTAFLLTAILIFYISNNKLKWSLFCLGIAATYFVNVPSIIYYILIGGQKYFSWGTSPENIYVGSVLNLVFILFWGIGYILVIYMKRKSWRISNLNYTKFVIYLLFVISIACYIYRIIQNYSYGYSSLLYSSSNIDNVGSFGIVGGFAGLTPILAATILIDYHSRKRCFLQQKINKPIYYIMWCILFIDVVKGITIDTQRGDVVAPIILIIFVLLVIGLSRRIISTAILAFFIVMSISPALDILRKDISVIDARDLKSKILKRTEMEEFSITKIAIREPARKSIAPETSFALKSYADREGFVGFKPYFNTLFDPLIPRSLWPHKPIKRSVDGTFETYVEKIAAKEFGMTHQLWTFGGGEMYWQFGWLGVILGGFFVGLAWAYLFWGALNYKSFFMVAILLGMISWGAPLARGFDEFLFQFLSGIKVIGLFWLLDSTLRALHRVKYS